MSKTQWMKLTRREAVAFFGAVGVSAVVPWQAAASVDAVAARIEK